MGGYLVTEAEERLAFGGHKAQAINAGHREESGSPESSGAQATEGCRAGGAVTHYGTKHNPFGYSGATHCDTVAVRQGRGGEAQPQAAAPEVGEVT